MTKEEVCIIILCDVAWYIALVGVSNEVTIEIEHVTCSALVIDTYAKVSTMCSDFYNTYLSHIEIHPLDDVLRIECADDQHMP